MGGARERTGVGFDALMRRAVPAGGVGEPYAGGERPGRVGGWLLTCSDIQTGSSPGSTTAFSPGFFFLFFFLFSLLLPLRSDYLEKIN